MKKTCLLLIALLELFVAPSFGQKPCDTIIVKGGQRIVAEIVRADQRGILYSKCGIIEEREYFISQENIAEWRRARRVQASGRLSPNHRKEIEPADYERLHRANDLGKPKTIIWIGYSPSRAFRFDFDLTGHSFLQFGGEIGFKRAPVRLGLLVQPISWGSRTGNYANFKNSGLGGELGLVLKFFTLGRLTSHLSKLYFGFDVLAGRQAYTYDHSYGFSSSIVNKVTYTWTTIMPRLGCQFTWRMLAFDLALPIGYQRYHYMRRGSTDGDFWSGAMVIQPAASVGFRF